MRAAPDDRRDPFSASSAFAGAAGEPTALHHDPIQVKVRMLAFDETDASILA
jgi:hypothetical protein